MVGVAERMVYSKYRERCLGLLIRTRRGHEQIVSSLEKMYSTCNPSNEDIDFYLYWTKLLYSATEKMTAYSERFSFDDKDEIDFTFRRIRDLIGLGVSIKSYTIEVYSLRKPHIPIKLSYGDFNTDKHVLFQLTNLDRLRPERSKEIRHDIDKLTAWEEEQALEVLDIERTELHPAYKHYLLSEYKRQQFYRRKVIKEKLKHSIWGKL